MCASIITFTVAKCDSEENIVISPLTQPLNKRSRLNLIVNDRNMENGDRVEGMENGDRAESLFLYF